MPLGLIVESRIPKVFFKIDNLVVPDLDAFGFEELLHEVGAVKMVFSGEQSLAVHDTVRGHILAPAGSIHRPADHACRPCAAKDFRNSAIGCDFPVRDLACDVIHALEKMVVVRILSQSNILKC